MKNGICAAAPLIASVEVGGSTTDTAMASTPAATRSSSMRCWTAASARSGYLNCRSKSGSSAWALATAASMIFQKSDGPFTTKAIVGLSWAMPADAAIASANAAESPAIIIRFMGSPPD